MTLNRAQREQTSAELRDNFAAAGISDGVACADLGWSAAEFAAALAVSPGADPVSIWLLRDYLEGKTRARGVPSISYSVLTERARASASGWFRLRTPPV